MLRVGLTGGYATGKSFVAAELERLGCHVIFADRLGHQVLEPHGDAYGAVVRAFGPAILRSDGSIDRKALAAIVFGSPERLALLTSFVHPAVFRMEERFLAEWSHKDPFGIAVVEAAILIETGRYKLFDRLLLTTCDSESQIERAMTRDQLSHRQVEERLARQLPLEEKKSYADFVIDTGGTEEDTRRQVKAVFDSLKQLAQTATEA